MMVYTEHESHVYIDKGVHEYGISKFHTLNHIHRLIGSYLQKKLTKRTHLSQSLPQVVQPIAGDNRDRQLQVQREQHAIMVNIA